MTEQLTAYLNAFRRFSLRKYWKRSQLIRRANALFFNGFTSGKLEYYCQVERSVSVKSFKHRCHSWNDFLVVIKNDHELTQVSLIKASEYFIENDQFIRQLVHLGFETLILKGENKDCRLDIPLIELMHPHKYVFDVVENTLFTERLAPSGKDYVKTNQS